MTIDVVVRTANKAIFNGRFYPDTFLQKDGGLPQWPAGRYVVISAINESDIGGTDLRDTDNTIVQIDVAANTYAERESLVNQVIAAMQNLDPPCTRENVINEFEGETRTYRALLEYTFYASSAATS